MNRWRLLVTGKAPGPFNMALDEAIAAAAGRGIVPPTLRFYGWEPRTLSIGYFQKVREETIAAQCRERKIALVRRPTGGKAVLHGGDLTYSVSAPSGDSRFPSEVNGAYRVIAEGLVAGLRRLGTEAEIFENLTSRDRSPGSSPQENPSCFAAPFGHEIAVRGRKLVGSAQRRWRDRFLQHGSIQCGGPCGLPSGDPPMPPRPARGTGLAAPSLCLSDMLSGNAEDHSITLQEILGRPVHPEELIAALCEGFRETLKVDLEPGEIDPREMALAQELERDKYGTEGWNFRR